MHQWHTVHPTEVYKLDVLNTGCEIHACKEREDLCYGRDDREYVPAGGRKVFEAEKLHY